MAKNNTDAELIEKIGLLSAADGSPPILGQIWGLVMLQTEPISAAEIAEQLGVSRGSVSTNARRLEEIGVLVRRGKPGDRQSYYAMRENPYATMLQGVGNRYRAYEAEIKSIAPELSNPTARKRAKDLAQYYGEVAKALEVLHPKLKKD